MTTPKRAAYYCRVSTDDQVLNYGLDVQASDCERYAAARGYEIVDRFVDEGFSGADDIDDRPELQRALMAVAAREFEVLMVPMYDRLARSLEVALEILPLLLKSKVTLVEVRTEQEFKGLGSLVGLIALWGAADEHKKILDRTKKGHIRRAKSKKVAGPPAFGYDRTEDGSIVVNEEEAVIVREIFRLYLEEGYGVDKIAALLNARGIPTKRAKSNAAGKTKFRGADRWQRSTILCMFRNPVYKGEYVYGKTHGKVPAGREYKSNPDRPVKSKDVRRALRNREHNPHEQVVFQVPAIVDAETWERIQAQKTSRANSGPIKRLREGATKYTYLFPTLVRCHECKRVMTAWKQPYHRKRDGSQGIRGYYTCRNKDLPCVNLNKYHHLDNVDFAIVSRLVPFLRDPELTRDGLSEAIRQKKQEHDILSSQAQALTSKKEEAGRKLDRLIDEFAGGTGLTADRARARCAELEREMEEYNGALKRLQSQLDDLSYQEDHQKIETVVALFQAIATYEYPADLTGLSTLDAIWWGRDIEAGGEMGPLPELNPDHPLVKIVNSLVKYVTIGLNSEIIDYRLRITPRPIEMLSLPTDPFAPDKVPGNGGRAVPIGQPEPVIDASGDAGNYKAKRNSITLELSSDKHFGAFEWALPLVNMDVIDTRARPYSFGISVVGANYHCGFGVANSVHHVKFDATRVGLAWLRKPLTKEYVLLGTSATLASVPDRLPLESIAYTAVNFPSLSEVAVPMLLPIASAGSIVSPDLDSVAAPSNNNRLIDALTGKLVPTIRRGESLQGELGSTEMVGLEASLGPMPDGWEAQPLSIKINATPSIYLMLISPFIRLIRTSDDWSPFPSTEEKQSCAAARQRPGT